jgi:hypothetical protein
MNRNGVAKHYGTLTAEERFRLILAAGARGDKGEQARLVGAGRRLALSVADHGPFALAFNELAVLTFGELLAVAADYLEALALIGDASRFAVAGHAPGVADGEAENDADELAASERSLDVALALGYLIQTKVGGWKLFCEKLSLPPFAVWLHLPGYDRLERALSIAEQLAFSPQGVMRWLNRSRPDGEVAATDVPFTTEARASGLERLFRQRVIWWGGTPVGNPSEDTFSCA